MRSFKTMTYKLLKEYYGNGTSVVRPVVIRKSDNIYNQSLIASLIQNNGKDKVNKWLNNFISNFARSPKGNDRAQILAVAAGEADIAIANTYYYALMLSGQKGEEQREAAKKVDNYRLNGASLYVTLEPCLMCFGACIHARIDRLIFATEDQKSGVVINNLNLQEESFFNHKISVSSGILATESSELLKKFFQERRN